MGFGRSSGLLAASVPGKALLIIFVFFLDSIIPGIGASLQKPFREYLEAQRAKLHNPAGDGASAVRINQCPLISFI